MRTYDVHAAGDLTLKELATEARCRCARKPGQQESVRLLHTAIVQVSDKIFVAPSRAKPQQRMMEAI